MTIRINAPQPISWSIEKIDCPTCEQETEMLCKDYEWYGPSIVCLNCGDRWNGGEMQERPFMRAWREKSIKRAKQQLAHLEKHFSDKKRQSA